MTDKDLQGIWTVLMALQDRDCGIISEWELQLEFDVHCPPKIATAIAEQKELEAHD